MVKRTQGAQIEGCMPFVLTREMVIAGNFRAAQTDQQRAQNDESDQT